MAIAVVKCRIAGHFDTIDLLCVIAFFEKCTSCSIDVVGNIPSQVKPEFPLSEANE